MNLINKYFRKNSGQYDYFYNIIIIIYGVFILSYYILIILYYFCSEERRNNNNPPLQNNQENHVNQEDQANRDNQSIPGIINNNINSLRAQESEVINLQDININVDINNRDNQNNHLINHNPSNHFRIPNNNRINAINPIIKKQDIDKSFSDNIYKEKLNKSFTSRNINNLYNEFTSFKNPENLNKRKNCVLCQLNRSKIIIVPCGHRCICSGCFPQSRSQIKNCPICRKQVSQFLEEIFDP